MEFMYVVFNRMSGESCHRRLRSLMCSRDVFRALINSLVCWSCFLSGPLYRTRNDWRANVLRDNLHSVYTLRRICASAAIPSKQSLVEELNRLERFVYFTIFHFFFS